MTRLIFVGLIWALLFAGTTVAGDTQKDYLYFRDANVPPFQKSREFFDMPDRPGHYGITLVSDDVGPLTFRILRVEDDVEKLIKHHRSYSLKDHEFSMRFANPKGKYDLIVEIANSNPLSRSSVSVIVVEEP
jgi:hypothetical protein